MTRKISKKTSIQSITLQEPSSSNSMESVKKIKEIMSNDIVHTVNVNSKANDLGSCSSEKLSDYGANSPSNKYNEVVSGSTAPLGLLKTSISHKEVDVVQSDSSLNREEDQKSETSDSFSLPTTNRDKNALRKSSLQTNSDVFTSHVRSIEDDRDNELHIGPNHELTMEESNQRTFLREDVKNRKIPTVTPPIASASALPG